jgi:hypothetical protein
VPRAGAAGNELAPCSDGKADVGLDLIGNVGADSAHGSQRLRDQGEPGRMPPAGNAARRHLHRAVQFGLRQQTSSRDDRAPGKRRVMRGVKWL